MKMKVSTALAAAALFSLLGCTTLQIAQRAEGLPEFQFHDAQLVPESVLPRFCRLGTSCLSMDHRPVEPCLVTTKQCSDQAIEPMPAVPAPRIVPAPRLDSL